jgi:hypothetical protein
MLNPFIICSTAEQAAFRAYADREEWRAACVRLGAIDEHIRAYDLAARRYAAATPYLNSDAVAYARRLAYQALLRGEAMPTDIEQVVSDENAREMARMFR